MSMDIDEMRGAAMREQQLDEAHRLLAAAILYEGEHAPKCKRKPCRCWLGRARKVSLPFEPWETAT